MLRCNGTFKFVAKTINETKKKTSRTSFEKACIALITSSFNVQMQSSCDKTATTAASLLISFAAAWLAATCSVSCLSSPVDFKDGLQHSISTSVYALSELKGRSLVSSTIAESDWRNFDWRGGWVFSGIWVTRMGQTKLLHLQTRPYIWLGSRNASQFLHRWHLMKSL